ncbi:SMC-Scp complex subunit ScpB [Candidatus Bathyarchaeota archaeon]|nr:SMC-Scp complex subunit ScpB [Candidatus Bathyarchaeota archaeon]
MTSKQKISKVFSKKKYIDELAKLEAALYVAGRPLNLKTLGSIIGTRSKKKVRVLVDILLTSYQKRDGALELSELKGERFVLQLKPQYVSHVKRLAMRPLLSKGPLKTLAYIAYRQPILKTKVISVRGSHAYNHLKELKTLNLITTETFGRTKIIKTTDAFADYFNLSYDLRSLKRQLTSIFSVYNKLDESIKN